MPRRRYTRKDKATATVAAALSTVQAAAESTGIPRQTIQYWLQSEEFGALRQKTREEAAQGWSVLGHLAQAELVKRIPTMESRDLVILAGLSTDKSQLLSGAATSRIEGRDITGVLDDHETEALRNWVDGLKEPVDADAAG